MMWKRLAYESSDAGAKGKYYQEVRSVSETDPIQVISVDDHQVVRGGIKFALLDCDDIELVGEAHDGEEALRLCEQLRPDVALVDLMMPGMDGVETTRAIRKRFPHVQVLVLTSFHDKDIVPRAMQAGAIGYLLKGVSNQDLIEAIHAAASLFWPEKPWPTWFGPHPHPQSWATT